MKNKILNTFVFLLVINLTAGYAQDITCKGIITDANTNLPLQDVRIYPSNALNTLIAQSGENGEFQLPPLKAGSKLIVKKSGYAWYVLRVNSNDLQQVKLVPIKPSGSNHTINGEIAELKLYFDGQLVPEEDMDEAMSVDSSEAGMVNFRANRVISGNFITLYYQTK